MGLPGNATRSRRYDVLGRVASLVAASSAALHVATVPEHFAHSPLSAVLMAAMAFGCAGCARHLWRGSRLAAWGSAAVMTALMLGLHLSTALGGGSAGHGHAMARMTESGSQASTSATSVATVLLGSVELVLLVCVVFVRTRVMPPEVAGVVAESDEECEGRDTRDPVGVGR